MMSLSEYVVCGTGTRQSSATSHPVDIGREALDRAATGSALQAEPARDDSRLLPRTPEREQLVDARLCEPLGAPAPCRENGRLLWSSVRVQDLPYAFP